MTRGGSGRYLALAVGLGLGALFAAMGAPLVSGGGAPLAIPGLRGRASQLPPPALAEIGRVAGWEFLGAGAIVAGWIVGAGDGFRPVPF